MGATPSVAFLKRMWSHGQSEAELQAPGQQEVGSPEGSDAEAGQASDAEDASRRPEGQPRQPVTSSLATS